MTPHLPTLLLAMATAFAVLLLQLTIARCGRLRRNRALRDWTLGAWCAMLSLAAFGVRHQMPRDANMLLSNGLMLLALVHYGRAAYRFRHGQSVPGWFRALALLCVLTPVAILPLPWPQRTMIACLAHVVLLCVAVRWLAPVARPGPPAELAVALTLALAALCIGVRGADAALNAGLYESGSFPTLRQGGLLYAAVLCVLMSGLGFTLACFERLAGEMEHVAHHDALTGLLNRGAGEARLAQALDLARLRGEPLALVMLDIDHFKQVNDLHGHQVGDRVLHTLGATLQAQVRETDTCIRMGGEEFAILMPACDLAHARHRAEIVRQAVEAAQVHDDRGVRVALSVSVGVAVALPDQALNVSRLYVRADRALYRAKQGGRNRVEQSSHDSNWVALGPEGPVA